MQCVCPDVADRSANSGLLRVGPPRSLLGSSVLLRQHQPTLEVLNEYFPYDAHLSRAKQLFGVPD